jgi:SSS family solute:Na+ symporter
LNIPLLLCAIFGLQIICFIYASFITSKNPTKEGYFLASKNLSFFPLMMTFVATLVGGGSTLGAAEEAFTHGYIIFLYPLGGALGLILIAFCFGQKLQKMKISTFAQVLEDVYKSPFLRKVASIFSMVALFSIFVAQVVATRKFLLSLGIDSDVALVLFWMLVSLYTAWGGLKAVAYTDVIQGLFFITILVIAFIFLNHPINLDVTGNLFIQQEYDIEKYVSWLLMPMLFMLIEQDVVQRCLGAKNGAVIKKSALVAALITLLVSLIPICFGVSARFCQLQMPLGSSVLICTISNFMHPILSALVGSSVMAAIVSTADSQLNAISSNLSCDFFKKLNISQIRILTFIIACVAIISSYLFDNIIDVILISFEIYVTTFFVPLIMGLFVKDEKKQLAYLSSIAGLFSYLFFKYLLPQKIPSSILALLISWFVYTIVRRIKK